MKRLAWQFLTFLSLIAFALLVRELGKLQPQSLEPIPELEAYNSCEVVVRNPETTTPEFVARFKDGLCLVLAFGPEIGLGSRFKAVVTLPEREIQLVRFEVTDLNTGHVAFSGTLPEASIRHPEIAGRLTARLIRAGIRIHLFMQGESNLPEADGDEPPALLAPRDTLIARSGVRGAQHFYQKFLLFHFYYYSTIHSFPQYLILSTETHMCLG